MTIPSSEQKCAPTPFRLAVFWVIEVVLYRGYELPSVLETRLLRLIQPYQFHVVTTNGRRAGSYRSSVGLLPRYAHGTTNYQRLLDRTDGLEQTTDDVRKADFWPAMTSGLPVISELYHSRTRLSR